MYELMSEFQKAIVKRLELVNRRLQALDKEAQQLREEQTALYSLSTHYAKTEYDSISEERRVTEGILNPPKNILIHDTQPDPVIIQPQKHSGGKPKGTSMYDEPVAVLFTTLPNPIKTYVFAEALRDLTGKTEKQLSYKNIGQILKQQVRKGNIKRSNMGSYTWIGGTINANTATVPTGRCPETQKSE